MVPQGQYVCQGHIHTQAGCLLSGCTRKQTARLFCWSRPLPATLGPARWLHGHDQDTPPLYPPVGLFGTHMPAAWAILLHHCHDVWRGCSSEGWCASAALGKQEQPSTATAIGGQDGWPASTTNRTS